MKGNVFIAWGGNKSLADNIANRLKEKAYIPQVGGDTQQSFFIGNQIIDQIQRAQMAIILVQNFNEDLCKDDKYIDFRPNLMFEWGFLFAKLMPENVHTYLINIKPNELPSDLQGRWSNEVDGSLDENSLSDYIVNDFLSKETNISIDVSDIFVRWEEWKHWMEDMKTRDYFNESKFANILIHSIQPAYYYNDLKQLKNIINGLNCKTRLLKDVIEVVLTICDFYFITESQLRTPSLGELKNIKDELVINVKIGEDELNNWVNLIRIDFLGLCYMFMADSNEIEDEREDYLAEAISCFKRALDLLQEIKQDYSNTNIGYCELWSGYINRNVGVIESEMKIIESSKANFDIAYHSRVNALKHFKSYKAPDILLTHLELEKCLVSVEMMKYGYCESRTDFKETLSALKRLNKQFDLWKLVIKEFNKIAPKYTEENYFKEFGA